MVVSTRTSNEIGRNRHARNFLLVAALALAQDSGSGIGGASSLVDVASFRWVEHEFEVAASTA
jgi:hypothetical protein